MGSAKRREKGPAQNCAGNERLSSQWLQDAQRNCTAGEPVGHAGQCSARPADEDAIYQSVLKLKGVAGDMAQRMSPDMSMEAPSEFLCKINF